MNYTNRINNTKKKGGGEKKGIHVNVNMKMRYVCKQGNTKKRQEKTPATAKSANGQSLDRSGESRLV